VFAYVFQDAETRVQHYWRDVGNVDAFYEANLELTHVEPELNLYDDAWPIWTYQAQVPSAKFVLEDAQRQGRAVNSLVAGGCIISGALVRESLLFSNVSIAQHAVVERSVILPNVDIRSGCRLKRAVVDEHVSLPPGTVIGENAEEDRRRYFVTRKGVVLVTRDMMETA
jgi:glucose-1-phosphate adenylyltransferase